MTDKPEQCGPAQATTSDGEDVDQAVRGVQAWMALDLHMVLGRPVDPRADSQHQGHGSWADWWADLLRSVRQLTAARQYGQRLAAAVPTEQDVRDFIRELDADVTATPAPTPVHPGPCGQHCDHAPEEQPPVNPPDSTQEQLHADVLALIDMPPYLSTACETAAACERAYEGNRRWIGRLQRAEQLHARCRLSHKFTGQPCSCACHRPTV